MKSKRIEALLTAADELATQLEAELGKDFRAKYPARTAPATMAGVLATAEYRMWLAWAAIEQARHLLTDKRGEYAASFKPCPDCAGKGKRELKEEREMGEHAKATRIARNIMTREVICDTCAGAGKVRKEGDEDDG